MVNPLPTKVKLHSFDTGNFKNKKKMNLEEEMKKSGGTNDDIIFQCVFCPQRIQKFVSHGKDRHKLMKQSWVIPAWVSLYPPTIEQSL